MIHLLKEAESFLGSSLEDDHPVFVGNYTRRLPLLVCLFIILNPNWGAILISREGSRQNSRLLFFRALTTTVLAHLVR